MGKYTCEFRPDDPYNKYRIFFPKDHPTHPGEMIYGTATNTVKEAVSWLRLFMSRKDAAEEVKRARKEYYGS